ncbi:uncharacterized protein LOC129363584 [Poeciliopsis prolifica]|uniref:uncharacterized protein LOC129363584 n=1 Tax=Poeciliopsis prolifica TaxID=188132 RepID=UPI002413C96F|nr:uncharacterized protein LOC129363584 [Poeciliopsis prolifica]
MGSCAAFLFFVFLRFIILSEQDCNDQFVIDDEIAKSMTELISLANCSSLEETLKCTVWINKDRDFFKNVKSECFDEEDSDLKKKCPNITAESDKIYMLHFRCLFAKVRNVKYSDEAIKSVFEDCQHFISGIDTIRRLWNTSDNTSHADQITNSPSQTPDPPITWPTAFVLVLLLLSVVVNIMQWLNSFQQKRRLNVKQKAMNTECISLNEDATAAEKSPEESVTYSNETVY